MAFDGHLSVKLLDALANALQPEMAFARVDFIAEDVNDAALGLDYPVQDFTGVDFGCAGMDWRGCGAM